MAPAEKNGVVMFMAIDIVGSVEFKLRHNNEADEGFWLDPFERFFRLTPIRFIGRIAEACKNEKRVPVSNVWRVRGDEIIFMSRLSRPLDAYLLFTALLKTVLDCNTLILGGWGLKVRGCAWAAQLSGRNRALIIPEMHDSFLDYLGPDVDAGFRLTACAGEGDVTVSYNLVHLLASLPDQNQIQLRYAEDRVLKGVVEQLPYPIVLSSSAAVENPERYPHSPGGVVSLIESQHPALRVLTDTVLQF